MRSRPAIFLWVAALITLSPMTRAGEEEPARAIALRAFQLSPHGDWNMKGRLTTRIDGDNAPATPHEIAPSSWPIVLDLENLKDGARQVTFHLEKKEEEVGSLRLIFPHPGSSEKWRGIELKSGRVIHDPKSFFLESAFSVEDLALAFLAWKKQELVGTETWRDRACWRLISRPSRADQSAYAEVESWIDQEYNALVHAVARDAEGKTIKEFNVRSVQKIEEVWMLKRLDLDAPSLGVTSRLQIEEAHPREPVAP